MSESMPEKHRNTKIKITPGTGEPPILYKGPVFLPLLGLAL